MSKTERLFAALASATDSKADTPLYQFFARFMRGEDLQVDKATEFSRALTGASANSARIAGALVATTAKGETFAELAGMARVMRERAVKISSWQKNFTEQSIDSRQARNKLDRLVQTTNKR
jgi:anthranilate phosphoribosyltransferase